jgi:hypothetical protein
MMHICFFLVWHEPLPLPAISILLPAQAAGLPEPLAINMMRDPLAREVSNFYYLMWGPRQETDMQKMRQKFQRLTHMDHPPTINEYLAWTRTQSEMDGCLGTGNMQTRYFCGFHAVCADICSEAALNMAKQVLEQAYIAVGILEQFNRTLQLLEVEQPDWFAGIEQEYQTMLERSARGHLRTHSLQHHEAPTAENTALLQRHHGQDVKLYRHACAVFLRKGREHGLNWAP